jgi:hypothetical protein
MRRFCPIDRIANRRTVTAFERFVFCKGVGIDIDFPTNAAAMLAFVGYAFEFFIICRGVKLHGVSSGCKISNLIIAHTNQKCKGASKFPFCRGMKKLQALRLGAPLYSGRIMMSISSL